MKHTVAMILAAVGVILLAGCTVNPATGRRQFDLLSRDKEIALGAEAMAELIDQFGGEVTSTALREYVTRIGRRMAALTEADNPSLPWQFTVLNSEVINAFALPGGKVFISRGLVELMAKKAQLAATLGHEIGHVTAQHIDERLSRAMGAQFFAEILGAAVGDEGVGAAVPYIVGAGSQAYLLSFGRSQEREADRLGIRYMTAAGYDPGGMIGLLSILVEASEGASSPPEFLSTHPNPKSRQRDAADLISRDYGYTVDKPDYKKFPERFRRRALRDLSGAMSGYRDISRAGVRFWPPRPHGPAGCSFKGAMSNNRHSMGSPFAS